MSNENAQSWKTFKAGKEHGCEHMKFYITACCIVHEALACLAYPWFITTDITVVEKWCRRGHYSPLQWTGIAAEGELDWLSS